MMPIRFPDAVQDLNKRGNHTLTTSEVSSGYTVIGVTTIDRTLGWDTVTTGRKTSASSEPSTVTKTVMEPIDNRPIHETETVSSFYLSTVTRDIMSTVTVDPNSGDEPFSTIWVSSLDPPTNIPTPLPTTSAAASPKSYLTTVELVGVVIGIICLLTMMCLPILFIIWRRRRSSTSSDTQNNINITVGNGGRSRWSHSDDSAPTPLPVPDHKEYKELKTEVVKRPLRVVSPPPRYNDYWKGADEYEMGVRDSAGEASGSKSAETHYSDPKGKGKEPDDNWI